jgi:hypothetical protein
MMPPRRPHRRTNSMLVANRSMQVMYKTVQWQTSKLTLEEIRQQVQEKVWEKLSR